MNNTHKEDVVDDMTLAILNEDQKKLFEIILKSQPSDNLRWLSGYRPLCTAYKYKKYRFADTSLDSVPVNYDLAEKENTPLHWAIIHDRSHYKLEHIKKLLTKGANMNIENSLCQNAFDIALLRKKLPILQLLIDHISDDNIDKNTYLKLLFNLINGDYVDLAEQLLTKCMHIDIQKSIGDINFLNLAIEKRQLRVVKSLLDRGIDVDFYDKFDTKSAPAIYKACEVGDVDIVKLLLDNGANVYAEKMVFVEYHIRDYPIRLAIVNNHLKVVEELLNRGVDVNQTYIERLFFNKNCEITALHLACQYKKLDIVKLLVERGGDIHRTCDGSATLIKEAFPHESEDGSDMEVYEYILSLKDLRLDLNTVKHILFWCAEFKESKKLLPLFQYINRLDPKDHLRYELDSEIINNGNLPAPLIHTAAQNVAHECIDIFINNDVDVNLRNKKMRTALHSAFRYRKLSCIISLIRNGANIDLVCDDNYLPVEYAFVYKIRESRFRDCDNNSSIEDANEFWDDDIEDIIEYYGYYVMKLKHLDLFVSDHNKSFITSKLENPDVDKHIYEKEVEQMKQTAISCEIPFITYDNFVRASLNRRIIFLNNPQILKILSSQDNYSESFPEFADVISNLYHQALARKKLLDKFYEYPIFECLNKNLAYLCVKEVIDYFSNDDLKKIVNQYTFFD